MSTDQDWSRVDRLLEKRGWAPLNRDLSRILIAEQDGEIVGFSVLQMLPFAGPLFVERKHRGTGMADKLATDTINYLVDCNARGWFVIADSPHVPKLCERFGMHKVESPVYITKGIGSGTAEAREVA